MASKLKSFVIERDGGERYPLALRRSPVQLGDVEDVRLEAEPLAVGAAEQLLAEGRQPGRVVELVAVDAEHPRVRPRVALDESVGVAGPPNAHRLDVVELGGHAADRVPRPVRGHVVGDVEAVAEPRRVAQRLLHELVLVVDEHDADDLHRPPSGVRSSSRAAAARARAGAPGTCPWTSPPHPGRTR